MNTTSYFCPKCFNKIKAEDLRVGDGVKCPHCRQGHRYKTEFQSEEFVRSQNPPVSRWLVALNLLNSFLAWNSLQVAMEVKFAGIPTLIIIMLGYYASSLLIKNARKYIKKNLIFYTFVGLTPVLFLFGLLLPRILTE